MNKKNDRRLCCFVISSSIFVTGFFFKNLTTYVKYFEIEEKSNEIISCAAPAIVSNVSKNNIMFEIEETTTMIPIVEAEETTTELTTFITVAETKEQTTNFKETKVDGGFKKYNIKLPVEQQKYAYNLCKEKSIDFELFLALMFCESSYNPKQISKDGHDYGLCQIRDSNHNKLRKVLGVRNFLDPWDSMKSGVYILSGNLKKFGNSGTGLLDSLNSYNKGEKGYNDYLKKGNNSYSWYYGNKVVAMRNTLIKNGGL